jgi:ribosomal-protein-alanine N-acetyltransferase
VVLTTPRLQLRPFDPADDPVGVLVGMFRDERYSRFLSDRELVADTPEKAAALLAGYGQVGDLFAIVVATGFEAGTIAGHCAVYAGASTADRTIAFGLLPAFWKRGYAREACRALVDACFATPGVAAVRADTLEDNWPARRVLEDLGFRLLEVTGGPAGDRAHYRLSWLDRR